MESMKSAGALYAELGQVLFDAGRYKEALDAFNKASKEAAPDIPQTKVLLNLGKTYRVLNKPREAQLFLIKAVNLDVNAFDEASKEFFEITKKEVESTASGGALQSVISKAFMRIFPSDTLTTIRKTVFELVEKGEFAKAERLLRSLNTLLPDDVDVLEMLGIALLRQGKVLESVDTFQKVIQYDIRRVSAHRGLGEVYNQLQKPQEAIDSFNHALDLSRDDAASFLGRGVAYRAINELGKSMKDLQRAIQLKSDDPDPNLYCELSNTQQAAGDKKEAALSLCQAARLFSQRGQYRLAQQNSQQAIELDRTCGSAYMTLGQALIQLGNVQEGLERLVKGADLTKSPQDYQTLAQAFLRQDNFSAALEAIEKTLAVAPDSVDELTLKGKILRLSQEPEGALMVLDRALSHDPRNMLALIEKGAVLEALNRQKDALKAYQQAVEQDPENHFAYQRIGFIYLELKNYEEALAALEKSITPTSEASLHTARGKALYYLDKYLEAITAFDQALRMNPEDFDACRYRGSCLRQETKYEEAVAALQLAIDLSKAQNMDKEDPWVYAELGESLRNLSRYKEAERAFKMAIGLKQNDDWALARYGENLRSLNKSKEAIGVLEQAVQVNPQNSFAWASLGAAYLDELRYRSALKAFDQAIEIEKGNYFFAWAWKGDLLRSNGRFQSAIEALDKALELNRTYWVLCHKVYTYQQMGDARCEQVRPILEEIQQTYPKDGWAYSQLGICLYASGRDQEALHALQKALDFDSTLNWVHVVRSLVLQRLGEDKLAEEAHRLALEKPDDPSSILNRGGIYEEIGAYEQAIQDYKAVVKALPIDAYNALAWLHADVLNENLEKATEWAQEAVNLATERYEKAVKENQEGGEAKQAEIKLANVLDTLGWIYYKRQMYKDALPILEAAASHNPEMLVLEDHLNLCRSALPGV